MTVAKLRAAHPGEDLAVARRVLKNEAEALTLLAQSLGDAFLSALDLLERVEGRVVVTGMGKSGHVGRKIAATLASTGTPAFFVHPAEASHGDLGMIGKADAVLAISNSGETSELSDILAYAKRFSLKLIGITSKPESHLAKIADAALVLPAAEEACSLKLAPTTSTTMTLALGDAIAVALLERRGFSAEAFREFHPGGKLGQRLRSVGELMHGPADLPLTTAGTLMAEAIVAITAHKFGCVGVIDERGHLIGIVTDGDLRRHMGPNLLALPVRQVMNQAPKSISAGQLAAEALAVMNEKAITSLFVVEGGRPVGILHIHDLLRAGIA